MWKYSSFSYTLPRVLKFSKRYLYLHMCQMFIVSLTIWCISSITFHLDVFFSAYNDMFYILEHLLCHYCNSCLRKPEFNIVYIKVQESVHQCVTKLVSSAHCAHSPQIPPPLLHKLPTSQSYKFPLLCSANCCHGQL